MRYLIGALIVVGLWLAPSESKADDSLPRYTAHRADSEIKIDGTLDELAWRNAASFGDFKFAWWETGKQ